MSDPYSFDYGRQEENPLALPFQFVASPFVGLIESLGDMGVPGFDALAQQPFLDPVYDFQEQHPFLSGVGEFASYFVPYAGWAKATRAVPALQGLAKAGARLGGTSPGARFALGETAPLALALGFAASLASGYLAVQVVWRIMARGRLHWFAPYCALVGALILLVA